MILSTREQKSELRKELREMRKSISKGDYETWSANIRDTLIHQPEFKKARTVNCYVSMNSRKEVDTHALIKRMFELGKEVAVPVTNFDDGTLSHFIIDSFYDLEENKWGVMEPQDGEAISVSDFDLVIVPMVGADEEGNRIGYGKGFYDRFLQRVDCPKIGLTFEQNIVEELPVEPFDIPMDKIITENRIIQPDKNS